MTTRIINFAGWAIVLSASLFFLFNNALHYFIYGKEQYAGGGFWPQHAPPLLVHVTFGMIGLLLGPFQFMPAIRNNYPRVHRTMGKIYLISITIAACASFDLSIAKIIRTEKAITYGSGLVILATAWLLTSGMAYWSVRRGLYEQHRQWMVRSFVVTCAFITFRFAARVLTEQFKVDGNAASDIMAWACWAVPLLIAEPLLQLHTIRKGNAVRISTDKSADQEILLSNAE